MTESFGSPQNHSRPLRILVVEDEFIIATDIAWSLQDLGHTVIGPAPTVNEALYLVRSEQMDCAVLDANLHGSSSAPIAAELAARDIKFVVLTGYANLKLETPTLDSAPRIGKPFTAGDFSTALATLFPSGSSLADG